MAAKYPIPVDYRKKYASIPVHKVAFYLENRIEKVIEAGGKNVFWVPIVIEHNPVLQVAAYLCDFLDVKTGIDFLVGLTKTGYGFVNTTRRGASPCKGNSSCDGYCTFEECQSYRLSVDDYDDRGRIESAIKRATETIIGWSKLKPMEEITLTVRLFRTEEQLISIFEKYFLLAKPRTPVPTLLPGITAEMWQTQTNNGKQATPAKAAAPVTPVPASSRKEGVSYASAMGVETKDTSGSYTAQAAAKSEIEVRDEKIQVLEKRIKKATEMLGVIIKSEDVDEDLAKRLQEISDIVDGTYQRRMIIERKRKELSEEYERRRRELERIQAELEAASKELGQFEPNDDMFDIDPTDIPSSGPKPPSEVGSTGTSASAAKK
jgi:hypothetical protein